MVWDSKFIFTYEQQSTTKEAAGPVRLAIAPASANLTGLIKFQKEITDNSFPYFIVNIHKFVET